MEGVLKKLGLKEDKCVVMMNAPEDIEKEMEKVPGIVIKKDLDEKNRFILYFTKELKDINEVSEKLVKSLEEEGRLWIVYPKKTSKKYKSDLSRDILWPMFGPYDFEPVSQFAVDEDWSAMRFRHVSEIKSMKRSRVSSKAGEEKIKEQKEK